jgi:hypothetical protein
MTDPTARGAARTWTSDIRSVVLEPTTPDDDTIDLSIYESNDGPGVSLTAQQVRELACALAQHADIIDPPKRRGFGECPNTPSQIIRDYVEHGHRHAERVFDTSSDPEGTHRISHMVNAFTIVALMSELDQVAPARAAKVAEILGDAWEAGDTVHEWLYIWHAAHTVGKPIGFNPPATLPLEIKR